MVGGEAVLEADTSIAALAYVLVYAQLFLAPRHRAAWLLMHPCIVQRITPLHRGQVVSLSLIKAFFSKLVCQVEQY